RRGSSVGGQVAGELRVTGAEVAEGAWGKQLVGEVRNASASAVAGVQLPSAVYRRDGRVEYVTLGFIATESLAPGQSFPFAVDLTGLAPDFPVERFDVFPEGGKAT